MPTSAFEVVLDPGSSGYFRALMPLDHGSSVILHVTCLFADQRDPRGAGTATGRRVGGWVVSASWGLVRIIAGGLPRLGDCLRATQSGADVGDHPIGVGIHDVDLRIHTGYGDQSGIGLHG